MSLLKSLIQLHFITPRGVWRLLRSFRCEGVTLMAIVRFAACYYADRCALVCNDRRLTYKELYEYSVKLSRVLALYYGVKSCCRVGIVARNDEVMAAALVALSRLGADIRLVNTDLSAADIASTISRSGVETLIYDGETESHLDSAKMPCRCVGLSELHDMAEREVSDEPLPATVRGGTISVFTGGTSGAYKEASRNSGVSQFLPPLFALIGMIGIDKCSSVLVALPLYHGFGLATFVISLAMGKKICMMKHFDAQTAVGIIGREGVEALPLVPAMLARILQIEGADEKLATLKCIISGGDRLDRKMIDAVHSRLGDILFNLYGTSEAGFFMLARPCDMNHCAEATIGRPIKGVACEVRDVDSDGVGVLWVKSRWAMLGRENRWQSTGDLVSCDDEGRFYYRGRKDNMVVCGGENVYIEHVESVIARHHGVANCVVYPVQDEMFGNVLNACIELRNEVAITEEEMRQWLRERLARAEMPHRMTFGEVSVTSTGKKARRF